ncbi:MAG TPA: peptidoglycan DD-metalloendopeptidase family protein [Beijerinckiaceae bacterium]|nr:peptidoglycan DD-metalloendopeptidase family protein [Beijerinckiaceae bacterium]
MKHPAATPRFILLVTTAALGMALAGTSASGQVQARPKDASSPQAGPVGGSAPRADETAEEKARRESDLKAVEEAIAANAESRRRLEAEIAGIGADRAKLSAALIETTARVRATEDRIGAVENRLGALTGSETALRRSLEARRGVMIEILAVLQRMGRRPLPAVLVRPEDMLKTVRASMLLGAVLPGMRNEVDVLAQDLAELVRLSGAIASDRDMLARELADLIRERERLSALIAARQSRLTQAEHNAGQERERAADLGQHAKSLKELIERTETHAAAAKPGAEAGPSDATRSPERVASLAFRNPTRLAPKTPFAEARGLLPRPVSGETARAFGSPDGYGGTTRGVSILTRPQAVVSSPADGSVAFAGPFRSYGRLLIIDAGGGYYVLLAGMSQINVEIGQSVLAGEPVAIMGATASAAPGVGGIETNDPVLYVEFRKDGGSIDPGPWWAKSQGEKVRG